MPTPNLVWGTTDEIRFFKRTIPKEVTKLQFLLNYKEALQSRRNWDSLDKKKLFKELEKEINLVKKGE